MRASAEYFYGINKVFPGILPWGDEMKSNSDVLSSMLHTVQMGQYGIESVINRVQKPELREELLSQKKEYDAFEHRAKQIAKNHNWNISDIHPAVLMMSRLMAKAQLMGKNVDSKIAGMLIQGNTRGMIQGIKDLNHCPGLSGDVSELAHNLLNKENINIQKSQAFL